MPRKKKYNLKRRNANDRIDEMVSINNKQVSFKVDVNKNHNNGTFKIKPTISFHHCSTNPDEHDGFIKMLGDIVSQAMADALKWKKEWEADNPTDSNQMSIEDGAK